MATQNVPKLSTQRIAEMTSSQVDMVIRVKRAMNTTYDAIGHDISGGADFVGHDILRDVIPDANYMEMYGHDKEAVAWFRSLERDMQEVILRHVFPDTEYDG